MIEAAGRELQAAHLADFIRLALNTGCRRNELPGLVWARVDFSERMIRPEGTLNERAVCSLGAGEYPDRTAQDR